MPLASAIPPPVIDPNVPPPVDGPPGPEVAIAWLSVTSVAAGLAIGFGALWWRRRRA